MKNKKLILIESSPKDYRVPLPERTEGYRVPSKVRIVFRSGEYNYVPRKHTFMVDTIFTSDEIQLIINELKRLNNNLEG